MGQVPGRISKSIYKTTQYSQSHENRVMKQYDNGKGEKRFHSMFYSLNSFLEKLTTHSRFKNNMQGSKVPNSKHSEASPGGFGWTVGPATHIPQYILWHLLLYHMHSQIAYPSLHVQVYLFDPSRSMLACPSLSMHSQIFIYLIIQVALGRDNIKLQSPFYKRAC